MPKNQSKNNLNPHPKNKLTIIGAGIVAAIEAYYEYKKPGQNTRITIYEKNKSLADTTTAHIAPSLTIDELIAVIPPIEILVKNLTVDFYQFGGLRVNNEKINDSESSKQFINKAIAISKVKDDEVRKELLLKLGRLSMELWEEMYRSGDDELKEILIKSNFNPCRETDENKLHDGYRIDPIYNIPGAQAKAERMKEEYEKYGYKNCKVLTPDEVQKLDPYLANFCDSHSVNNVWHDDATALWRPGGCINTQIFLPLFYAYLEKKMGQYKNEQGKIKNTFRLKLDRHIDKALFADIPQKTMTGLKFFDGREKHNKFSYAESNYVFCPGQVGVLNQAGFIEPPYAGFAGASLILNIPLSAEQARAYVDLNHCMEVHYRGDVVLAWQAKYNAKENKVSIRVAGTKAFYGDQKPNKDEDFAKNRNLLQLKVINDVLPNLIAIALGKKENVTEITENDLNQLENNRIAERWAGVRAVNASGLPTLGHAYVKTDDNHITEVTNVRETNKMGSGGVSSCHAAVKISSSIWSKEVNQEPFFNQLLTFTNSSR